ncbi:FAD/NAD(P)-binding domain-containing protein [Venturia nashicola]|uniref:FAD/NAD(P)-binding domain-containing protein n=1 Tax=Venturia nashicola TaxID=86259 RepID=A0A4Z1P1V8_9PEZI|nr:FAD/NAD(P)-binding domain-containing protein [Venturia nashicola]
MASNQPHILIVGGAYGGLSALNTLIALSSGKPLPEARKGGPPPGPGGQRGPPPPAFAPLPEISRALRTKPRYTIIDQRDGFYHTVGAPLGTISSSFTKNMWARYAEIDPQRFSGEDVRFIQASATGLDLEKKTLKYSKDSAEEKSISYDYLVLGTGMRRGGPVVPQSTDKADALEESDRYEASLGKAEKIVLVGGGAVGIEMSAETKLHFPNSSVVLVQSRDALLAAEPLPAEYKAKALDLVHEAGVEVKLGNRVLAEKSIRELGRDRIELTLSGGEIIRCDKVIYTATQKGANTGFLSRDLVDEKGCVRTRETLQFPTTSPNADFHFAVGDIVSGPGIKRSGPAQNSGKVAATNIVKLLLAAEENEPATGLATVQYGAPTMSLAVGTQAMTIRGGGLRWGKEVRDRAFGPDLGAKGTLEKLGLTKMVTRTDPLEDAVRLDRGKGEVVPVVANM